MKADGGNCISVNITAIKRAAILVALLLCFVMLPGCNSMDGAEKKVSSELNALKTSENTGSEITELRASLSENGKESFDGFIKKLRDFDFEIIESQKDDDKDDDYTLVSVRIKTYDFGKEYLAAWTEYLKDNNDPGDDLTDFYELLFSRLDSIADKDRISDIKIVCIDPLDNDEWIADIKENDELQDAIFGGMMSEMKALAAE